MSKAIFNHTLDKMRNAIEKHDVSGDTIPPAKRLAVALHRSGTTGHTTSRHVIILNWIYSDHHS